jgi:hypothetical protein
MTSAPYRDGNGVYYDGEKKDVHYANDDLDL